MDDVQFSQYLIEQDEIIDVKGITAHSVEGQFADAYTLFLRKSLALPSDDSTSGPYIYTEVITIPSRFVAEGERALGPNLRAAIDRFRSGRKSIGYFIDQWDDMDKFDVYVDVDYWPSPFDSAQEASSGVSSASYDVYKASRLEYINHRTMYVIQYRRGEILAVMNDREGQLPYMPELDVIGIIGRILQIISSEEGNK